MGHTLYLTSEFKPSKPYFILKFINHTRKSDDHLTGPQLCLDAFQLKLLPNIPHNVITFLRVENNFNTQEK